MALPIGLEILTGYRSITEDDVARLWRAVGWNWYENDDGYRRTANALNDERCTTIVAKHRGEIIGLAHVLDNGFTAYLCYLLVDPIFQGQGVGKALLAKFDECFFSCHRHMMADNDAVPFYRNAGYGHDGEYTAMAKWACEMQAPPIGGNDWQESDYAWITARSE